MIVFFIIILVLSSISNNNHNNKSFYFTVHILFYCHIVMKSQNIWPNCL